MRDDNSRELLTLRIGGGVQGIDSHAFTKVVSQFDRALDQTGRLHSRRGEPRPTWRVLDTRRTPDNALQITYRPFLSPRAVARKVQPVAAAYLWSGIRELSEAASIPEPLSEAVLETVADIYRQTTEPRTGIKQVSLYMGAQLPRNEAPLDERVGANVARALDPVSLAWGSVTGVLDLISTRQEKLRVGLSIPFAPPVTCLMPEELRAAVMGALDARVTVEGLVKRNSNGQIVRVDGVAVHREPGVEPLSARELWGSVPDLATGQSAVEFIRGQRDD